MVMTQEWHAPPYVRPTGERRRVRCNNQLVYVNQAEIIIDALEKMDEQQQRALLAACIGLDEPYSGAYFTLRLGYPHLFWKSGHISSLTVQIALSMLHYDEEVGEVDEAGFAPITPIFRGFIKEPWVLEEASA